jgi:cryptochrome
MPPGAAVHWFRKGLRVHDNPALLAAAQAAAAAHAPLYPVFVLDPWFLHPSRVGTNRVQFLLQSLCCLNESLSRHDSRLLVLRGKPEEVLKHFIAAHSIQHLTFETDTEPYARKRDIEVCRLAQQIGLTVSQHCSHTLWDQEYLLAKNGGAVPKSYQSMLSLVKKSGPPPKPLPAPELGDLPPLPASMRIGATQADGQYGVPNLAVLGYDPAEATAVIPGGEVEALRRMDAYLSNAR